MVVNGAYGHHKGIYDLQRGRSIEFIEDIKLDEDIELEENLQNREANTNQNIR
jgi:hypothetical protein